MRRILFLLLLPLSYFWLASSDYAAFQLFVPAASTRPSLASSAWHCAPHVTPAVASKRVLLMGAAGATGSVLSEALRNATTSRRWCVMQRDDFFLLVPPSLLATFDVVVFASDSGGAPSKYYTMGTARKRRRQRARAAARQSRDAASLQRVWSSMHAAQHLISTLQPRGQSAARFSLLRTGDVVGASPAPRLDSGDLATTMLCQAFITGRIRVHASDVMRWRAFTARSDVARALIALADSGDSDAPRGVYSFAARVGRLATELAWRTTAHIDVLDDGDAAPAPLPSLRAAVVDVSNLTHDEEHALLLADLDSYHAEPAREAAQLRQHVPWLHDAPAEVRAAALVNASAHQTPLAAVLDELLRRAPSLCARGMTRLRASNSSDGEPTTCRVCGAGRLHRILDARDAPVTLAVCRHCHHVHVNHHAVASPAEALACSATARAATTMASAWRQWLAALLRANERVLELGVDSRGVALDNATLLDVAPHPCFDSVVVNDLLACTPWPVDALRVLAAHATRRLLLFVNPEHRAFMRGRLIDVDAGADRCSLFNLRSIVVAAARAQLRVARIVAACDVDGDACRRRAAAYDDVVGHSDYPDGLTVLFEDYADVDESDASIYFIELVVADGAAAPAVNVSRVDYEAGGVGGDVLYHQLSWKHRLGRLEEPAARVVAGRRSFDPPDGSLDLLVRARDADDVVFFYERYRARLLAHRAWLCRHVLALTRDARRPVLLVSDNSSSSSSMLQFLLYRRANASAWPLLNGTWRSLDVLSFTLPYRVDAPLFLHVAADAPSLAAFMRRLRQHLRSLAAPSAFALVLAARLRRPTLFACSADECRATTRPEHWPVTWPVPPRAPPPAGELSMIMHVRNEHFFAPYFVLHHAPLFDAALVLDYASDDGTQRLFRTLAPSAWRLETSRNGDLFESVAVDEEIMDREAASFDANRRRWTIALNIPEFLVTTSHALYRQLASIEHDNCSVFIFRARLATGNDKKPLVPHVSLVKQRSECTLSAIDARMYARHMHRHRRGCYSEGRHHWNYTECGAPPASCQVRVMPEHLGYLTKFRTSPWPEVRVRLRQMAEADARGRPAHIARFNKTDSVWIDRARTEEQVTGEDAALAFEMTKERGKSQ